MLEVRKGGGEGEHGSMTLQESFAIHLVRDRNLLACHEVAHYGHRCDVLAVHRHKQLIFEYEFKGSAHDLRVAEFKKNKYKPYKTTYGNEIAKSNHWRYKVIKPWKRPHYFYFVVPEWLWEKEKEYLRSLDVGTIIYRENQTKDYARIYDKSFYVVKRTQEHKANSQNYYKALFNITHRLANIYAFRT